MTGNNLIAEARKIYRPEVVKCVLVAESPPAMESGRFFYFENVSKGDSLFWETMKVLYSLTQLQTGPPRNEKREYLKRFRDDGFYLLDAVDEPLGRMTPATKRRRIHESLPRLRNEYQKRWRR